MSGPLCRGTCDNGTAVPATGSEFIRIRRHCRACGRLLIGPVTGAAPPRYPDATTRQDCGDRPTYPTRSAFAPQAPPPRPSRRRIAQRPRAEPPRSFHSARVDIFTRCSAGCASPEQSCGQWTVLLCMCAEPNESSNRAHTCRFRYSASDIRMSTKSNRFNLCAAKKFASDASAPARTQRSRRDEARHGGFCGVRRACCVRQRRCAKGTYRTSSGPT